MFTFRGIRVEIHGECRVHWKIRTGAGKKRRTIHCRGNETYMNTQQYVVGSKDGDMKIPKGSHQYSYKAMIPQTAAPSFQGEHGKIT